MKGMKRIWMAGTQTDTYGLTMKIKINLVGVQGKDGSWHSTP